MTEDRKVILSARERERKGEPKSKCSKQQMSNTRTLNVMLESFDGNERQGKEKCAHDEWS